MSDAPIEFTESTGKLGTLGGMQGSQAFVVQTNGRVCIVVEMAHMTHSSVSPFQICHRRCLDLFSFKFHLQNGRACPLQHVVPCHQPRCPHSIGIDLATALLRAKQE